MPSAKKPLSQQLPFLDISRIIPVALDMQRYSSIDLGEVKCSKYPNPPNLLLRIGDLHWLQESAHDSFSNGESLWTTLQHIASGKLEVYKSRSMPNGMPTIRVIKLREAWFTVDTRRPLVYKIAFHPDQLIPVCEVEMTREIRCKVGCNQDAGKTVKLNLRLHPNVPFGVSTLPFLRNSSTLKECSRAWPVKDVLLEGAVGTSNLHIHSSKAGNGASTEEPEKAQVQEKLMKQEEKEIKPALCLYTNGMPLAEESKGMAPLCKNLHLVYTWEDMGCRPLLEELENQRKSMHIEEAEWRAGLSVHDNLGDELDLRFTLFPVQFPLLIKFRRRSPGQEGAAEVKENTSKPNDVAASGNACMKKAQKAKKLEKPRKQRNKTKPMVATSLHATVVPPTEGSTDAGTPPSIDGLYAVYTWDWAGPVASGDESYY